MAQDTTAPPPWRPWSSLFARKSVGENHVREKSGPSKWAMGILEDKETIEVPGMPLAQRRRVASC
jgi:hypothetical protein